MSLRTTGFAGMLVVTMAMSVFAFFALAVVASELEAEFGLSKFQLGILGAVNTGSGGLFAPRAGHLVDRYGGRATMGAVLVISAGSAVIIALAQSYLVLLVGMAIAGLAQGLANPSTNGAIATGITSAQRGVVTGIKQSGVQLAVFTSGFAMPVITRTMGWRAGMWMTAAISFLALGGLRLITRIDQSPSAPTSVSNRESRQERRPTTGFPTSSTGDRLPRFVYQVAIYGFLMGLIGGGLGRFLPLFAEESVGLSPETAGRVFGLQGLVAIPTRIASGLLLDRGMSARRTLIVMGLGGSASVLLILAAADGRAALLWIGTIIAGLTLGSWNTAANLAMIRERRGAGRASGVLIFGFLSGLTLAGPIVGLSIDTFDSYSPAWIGSAALALMATMAVTRRRREPAR